MPPAGSLGASSPTPLVAIAAGHSGPWREVSAIAAQGVGGADAQGVPCGQGSGDETEGEGEA